MANVSRVLDISFSHSALSSRLNMKSAAKSPHKTIKFAIIQKLKTANLMQTYPHF